MDAVLYTYANCDTCRKALRFLKERRVSIEPRPIREQPPTMAELQKMLACYGGNVRKLFNTSGRDYKAMQLGDKLSSMSPAEALTLLSQNGNLVKRPFLLVGDKGVVGFDESAWTKLLLATT